MEKAWKIGRIVLLVLAAAMACGTAYTRAAASDKGEIQSAVRERLSGKQKVRKTFWLDYDKNGRKEAFILTGKIPKTKFARMMDDGFNTLWFGYKSGGKVHIRKIKKNIAYSAHTLRLESAAFLCAGWVCATSYPEDIYQVDGNKVSVIFSGDSIRKRKGNDFISIHSTYDSFYDNSVKAKLGHTWKPYFFYYKDGQVYEYEAERISKADFVKKYSNAASELKKVHKKKRKVISILVRSNGMIHINYRRDSGIGDKGFWYVTYQVSDGKLIKLESGDGTYKEKLYG